MKRILRSILMSGLAVCLIGMLEARGQAAGSFARLGFGARGMAMGNALVADADGESTPYYNPALAPFAARQNLQASVAFLTFDRELQFLQFASALPPSAGIAAGLIHAGVAGIDGRSESGFHTEDLKTDEYALFLAFGLRLGRRASIGLGLQVFRADLYEELEPVNSAGLDLGLTLQVTSALRLGIVADDLLAKYSWDSSGLFSSGGKRTTDEFPLRLRIGAAYTLMEGRGRLVAEYESRVSTLEHRMRSIEVLDFEPREVADVESVQVQESLFRLGGEIQLAEPFAIRAGLDRIGDSLVGMRPTAGFLITQPVGSLNVWFEYAFTLESHATGTMHIMTVTLFL